jgi:hypothetical protein
MPDTPDPTVLPDAADLRTGEGGRGGLLDLIPPRYGAGSLADILPGVLAALGVAGEVDPLGLAGGPLAGVRRVVVLLVDGLGYHLLADAAPHAPAIGGVLAGRYGWLVPATTGFPSTTPVSLVTLATGAPPGAHGVVGFTVAVPGTDRTLNHILWRGPRPGEDVSGDGRDGGAVDPYRWQPVPTAFERATRAGVPAVVVNRAEFAGSGLTVATYRGADYRPADGTDPTAAAVVAAVRGIDRGLVYTYHGRVDHAAHQHGLTSAQWAAAVADADRLVAGIAAGLPPDAALLVTADHGALDVPFDREVPTGGPAAGGARFDLDAAVELTGPASGLRVLAGEPRVRYAHALPGAAADLLTAWRETLAGRALVMSRDEAVATGWYGPAVSADAAARLGDVVAVCTGRDVLVAPVSDPSSARLVGYHGSLTRVEATVPVLVVRSGEVVVPGG